MSVRPAAAVSAPHGLHRVGGRPPLGRYVRLLWQRRHFVRGLSIARFRAETEQERLGIGWVVLRPLLYAVVYGSVFGLLLPSSSRPDNFVPFLVAGVFGFQLFASCLTDGAKSIVGNRGLLSTIHFPRAALPIAVTLQNAYAQLPMTALLLPIAVLFGEPPRLAWLQLVPVLVLFTLFCGGVSFITARLTVHIRDVAQLLPFLNRVLFYVSGIFFSVDRVVEEGPLRVLLEMNPVHVYLSLLRGAVLTGQPAEAWQWAAGAAWAAIAFAAGFVYFWAAEERYGRE